MLDQLTKLTLVPDLNRFKIGDRVKVDYPNGERTEAVIIGIELRRQASISFDSPLSFKADITLLHDGNQVTDGFEPQHLWVSYRRHEAIAAVEAEGWKTMGSAPRGGRFLATATGDIERIAWDDPAAVVTVKAFKGPFICYAHEDDSGFVDEFGEVYRADGIVIDAEDLNEADNVLRLTHWRHLPAAPEVE